MKKQITVHITIVLLVVFFSGVAIAEKSTKYVFPEFSVHVSDEYLTLTKQNVQEIAGSNTMISDLNFFIDYFSTDDTLYLDAVHYQTYDEICIRLQPLNEGVDLSFMLSYDDSQMETVLEECQAVFESNGRSYNSITAYRHPQTVYIVYDGIYFEEQGYTTMYLTVAKINNKFYSVSISGISAESQMSEELRADLIDVVESMNLTGYADFDIPSSNLAIERYTSEFSIFDGLHFGDDIDMVTSLEKAQGNTTGDIYEVPAWSKGMAAYLTYSKELTYDNIPYLGVDYSSKSYHFDDDDIFFSVFYEFRSGYNLDLDGQDDISNFAPAYSSIELYLRDLYGNPDYQHSKGTKCEIDGHGMREAKYLLDGLENDNLYDYSEWLINDPQGQIKIEHIMYFTGYIYKHNVSIEIIR